MGYNNHTYLLEFKDLSEFKTKSEEINKAAKKFDSTLIEYMILADMEEGKGYHRMKSGLMIDLDQVPDIEEFKKVMNNADSVLEETLVKIGVQKIQNGVQESNKKS